MMIRWGVLALVLAAPAGGRADPTLECGIGLGSQVEIGDCLAATEARVDETVAQALGFAMEGAKALDAETGRPGAVPALEAGQAAWSAFRDAHCAFVGATFGGGSGTGAAIRACRIDLGRERVGVLMGFAG